ncbi:unnamed protein product [Musa textilis]
MCIGLCHANTHEAEALPRTNFPAKFQPLDRIEASAIVLRCRLRNCSSVLFHSSRCCRSTTTVEVVGRVPLFPLSPFLLGCLLRRTPKAALGPCSKQEPIVALGPSPRPTPGAEAGAGALPDRYDRPFTTCAIDLISPTTMLI